jgi:hypothetical protein
MQISIIVHYWGSKLHNRFLGHLSEKPTIGSSGLPQQNARNGIPGPWGAGGLIITIIRKTRSMSALVC